MRPGVVLTALHCVGLEKDGCWRGRALIEVRLWRDLIGEGPAPVYNREICWPDLPGPADDLAVLGLISRDTRNPPRPLREPRYCKLPEEGENVPAAARGFPTVASGNKAVVGERGEINLSGVASRFSSSGTPTARFKSTSEAETENARTNTWMCLSGGPLLCNGAVVGVMPYSAASATTRTSSRSPVLSTIVRTW